MDRGHEVALYCGGRDLYQDALTRRAEGRLQSWGTGRMGAPAGEVRALLHADLERWRPDQVVVCDAPLGGPLLEATLCAAEAGIPVVLIDNLYNTRFAEYFCRMHGPVADGILLTGLSCCYTSGGPPYLGQVPPLLDLDASGASAFLGSMDGPLMTVLAYDPRALALGQSLAAALPGVQTLFLSPKPVSVSGRVATPPEDAVLAGVLQRSDLVVGKCGFLQLSECLALGTPFLGLEYQTYYNPSDLPPVCQSMLHITSSVDAGPETVAAARRLLAGDYSAAGVHDGGTDGILSAVRFLESLPREPRSGCGSEAAAHGFTPGRVLWALGEMGPVEMLRCTMVRNEPEVQIFSLVCLVGGRTYRLGGKRYPSLELLREGAAAGRRHVRGVWEEDLVLLEQDPEFHNLPPLGLADPA